MNYTELERLVWVLQDVELAITLQEATLEKAKQLLVLLNSNRQWLVEQIAVEELKERKG